VADEQSIPDETQNTDEGGEKPLPESTETTPAENTTQTDANTPSTDEVSSETETKDEVDNIDKWAESQGIDLENPTKEQTGKLAQRLRDTQSKMHEATNKSADLEAGVSEVIDNASESGQIDAGDARMLKMEQQLAVTQFFVNTPEARQYDRQMADMVRAKPWLLNNLADLHKLARLESSGGAFEKITEKARQDERDLLNQKQRAGVSKPSASSKGGDNATVDHIMEGLKFKD